MILIAPIEIANLFPNTKAAFAGFIFNLRCTVGSFLQGSANAPKILFVIFEPNCPICHDLYFDAKPYVTAGAIGNLLDPCFLYKSHIIWQRCCNSAGQCSWGTLQYADARRLITMK